MKTIDKAMKLGLRAVHSSKKLLKKDVDAFVKAGLITAKQGRTLTARIVKEGRKVRNHIQKMVAGTVKDELKRQSPYVKKAVKKGAHMSIKGIEISAIKVRKIADDVAKKVHDILEQKSPAKKRRTTKKTRRKTTKKRRTRKRASSSTRKRITKKRTAKRRRKR